MTAIQYKLNYSKSGSNNVCSQIFEVNDVFELFKEINKFKKLVRIYDDEILDIHLINLNTYKITRTQTIIDYQTVVSTSEDAAYSCLQDDGWEDDVIDASDSSIELINGGN